MMDDLLIEVTVIPQVNQVMSYQAGGSSTCTPIFSQDNIATSINIIETFGWTASPPFIQEILIKSGL